MAKKGVLMQEVNHNGSLTKIRTGYEADAKKAPTTPSKRRNSIPFSDASRGRGVSFVEVTDAANADAGEHSDEADKSDGTADDHRSLEDIIARHPAHKKERENLALKNAASGPAGAIADVILSFAPGDELDEEERAKMIQYFADVYIGSTYRDVIVKEVHDYEHESLRLVASSHAVIVNVSQAFCEMLVNISENKSAPVFVDTVAGWICLLVIKFMVETAKNGPNKQSSSVVMCYEIDSEGGGGIDVEVGTSQQSVSSSNVRTPQTHDVTPQKPGGGRFQLSRNASTFIMTSTPEQTGAAFAPRMSPSTTVANAFTSENIGAIASEPRVEVSETVAPPALHLSRILFHCDFDQVADDQASSGNTTWLGRFFSQQERDVLNQVKPIDSINRAIVTLHNELGLDISKDTWGFISELKLSKILESIFSTPDTDIEVALTAALSQNVSRDNDSANKQKLEILTVRQLITLLDNSNLQIFVPAVAVNGVDGNQLIYLTTNAKLMEQIFPERDFRPEDLDRLKILVAKWIRHDILVLEGNFFCRAKVLEVAQLTFSVFSIVQKLQLANLEGAVQDSIPMELLGRRPLNKSLVLVGFKPSAVV
jgi:hypothetical protein